MKIAFLPLSTAFLFACRIAETKCTHGFELFGAINFKLSDLEIMSCDDKERFGFSESTLCAASIRVILNQSFVMCESEAY